MAPMAISKAVAKFKEENTRCCRNCDQNMFFGVPWSRIEVETVGSERNTDVLGWENFCQPDSDIV